MFNPFEKEVNNVALIKQARETWRDLKDDAENSPLAGLKVL